MDKIVIKGAHENNLKHINLEIPKNKVIVFAGLSGSGKSTLALDTLQRECQRQYMESMGMMVEIGTKPMVESIEGLSPAISINQSNVNRNPRSTVGTVTEIAPYLRVLFAKLGERQCTHCGKLVVQNYSEEQDVIYSELPDQTEEASIYEEMILCPHCSKSIFELTPSHFSYNKPAGACTTCKGVGVVSIPDVNQVIDFKKNIKEFAIHGWDQVYVDRYGMSLVNAGKYYGFPMDIDLPIGQYGQVQMDLLLYGVLSPKFTRHYPDVKPPKTVPEGRYEGVITNLMRRYDDSSSLSAKQKLEKLLIQQECPDCQGIRFRKEILEVRVTDYNIREVLLMPLTDLLEWLYNLKDRLTKEALAVVNQVIEDLIRRVERIVGVGAGYLCLSQPSMSLSPGETQRIKLASILGSSLTGVLYVLDEPSAGLHKRDIVKIIDVLRNLRDKGNTVIVIEHDLDIMRAADYIVDFGPGAGKNGGQIVCMGNVNEIENCMESITGQYLSKRITTTKRDTVSPSEKYLTINHGNKNNLKDISVRIPLERFVTVTGVSGAGKSTLIFEELANRVSKYFNGENINESMDLLGCEHLDGIILIDQVSIGRSTRSNAATYTDIFTDIRNLFGKLAKKSNPSLNPKDFSYNVPGGRCEKCQGEGKVSIPMNFMPDVEVICPVCRGKRYQKHVLSVKYKEHNIADVLDLTIDEAICLFTDELEIAKKLKVLEEVGLGYLSLGQSTTTLSGGEAQRIKLAKELIKSNKGRILYLFDEPTRGLHPHDANRLIHVFDRLVRMGNSVVVIEHNLQVIEASDWIIELGPEGGKNGGEIIACGTVEDIMNNPRGVTGQMLNR